MAGGQGAQGGQGFQNFMSIAAPLAAAGATAYGGQRGAMAAQIGLGAYNDYQDQKRRQQLGMRLAEIADKQADEELRIQNDAYNAAKPKVDEFKVVDEEAMAADDQMEAKVWDDGPPESVKRKTTDAKMDRRASQQVRLNEFLASTPEPVRNSAYDEIGALAASGETDMAMRMLMDRKSFMENVRLRELDYSRENARRQVEDARREYEFDVRDERERDAMRLQREAQMAASERYARADSRAEEEIELRRKQILADAEYRKEALRQREQAEIRALEVEKLKNQYAVNPDEKHWRRKRQEASIDFNSIVKKYTDKETGEFSPDMIFEAKDQDKFIRAMETIDFVDSAYGYDGYEVEGDSAADPVQAVLQSSHGGYRPEAGGVEVAEVPPPGDIAVATAERARGGRNRGESVYPSVSDLNAAAARVFPEVNVDQSRMNFGAIDTRGQRPTNARQDLDALGARLADLFYESPELLYEAAYGRGR